MYHEDDAAIFHSPHSHLVSEVEEVKEEGMLLLHSPPPGSTPQNKLLLL